MYFDGKWSDMDQEQQRAAKEQFGSRDAWQQEKQTRMAGDEVVKNPEAVKPTPTPSKVSNINNYDTTSYGAGANRDADRLSAADIRELDKQGFSSQEIVKYADDKYGSGTMGGGKAQAALDKHRQAAAPPPSRPTPPPTQPTPPPTQPTPPPTQPTPPPTQPAPRPTPSPTPRPTPSPTPSPQPDPSRWTPTPDPTQPPVNPTPGNPPPGSGDRPERPIQVPTPYDPPPWDPNKQVPDVIDDLTKWGDERGIGWSNPFVQDTKHSDAVMERGSNIDKPGDAESFLNKYVNMNIDFAAQSRANRPDIAGDAINNINKYGVDLTALDTSLRQRGQISRDRALISASNLFGDMHAMTPPNWNPSLGKQPEVEDPDLDIDDTLDRIDDLY